MRDKLKILLKERKDLIDKIIKALEKLQDVNDIIGDEDHIANFAFVLNEHIHSSPDVVDHSECRLKYIISGSNEGVCNAFLHAIIKEPKFKELIDTCYHLTNDTSKDVCLN